MAIQFVIDSGADILPEEAENFGFIHIPMSLSFENDEYLDGVTITHHTFYEKLIESDVLPTTSQISPATFEDVFRKVTDVGDIVLCFTLSSKLSGTYQSACIAAEEFPGKVFVIDTLSATIGERLLILRAMELINSGMLLHDVIDLINKEKHEVRILAVLDTLEYLKKGGRISAATAFAGGLLSIKPVITINEGAVEMCGKARGSKNSNNLLRKMILEGPGVDFTKPYAVAYSGLDDFMLKKYIEDNAELWQTNARELPVCTVGAVIGTHVGPGAIAVAFFERT